jgi:sarcosine oxidase
VLGIERFAPGHDRGSSHGASRIIRLGYFEHPSYVPLLRRAYAAWRELEQASGLELLHITGILEMGLPDSTLVRGTLASAQAHSLPHALLAGSDLKRRFPQFQLPADYVGVLQGDGGWIAVDPAFEAWISLAARAGAEMRTGVTVRAVEQHRNAVRVRTDSGAVEADCAIVAAGAWTRSLIPGLAHKLRVTREVMGWFDAPERARGMLDGCRSSCWRAATGCITASRLRAAISQPASRSPSIITEIRRWTPAIMTEPSRRRTKH